MIIPQALSPYLLIGLPLASMVVIGVLCVVQCVLFFKGHVVTVNADDPIQDSLVLFDVPEHQPCDRCGIKPSTWMKFLPRGYWKLLLSMTVTVNLPRPAEFIKITFDTTGWTEDQLRNMEKFGEQLMEESEGKYLHRIREESEGRLRRIGA